MFIPGKVDGIVLNCLLLRLLQAINDAGTIMTMGELKYLAYGRYGVTDYTITPDGFIVDEERVCTRSGLQEIADIYTDGFDAINF